MASSELRLNAVTIDRLGVAGYRPRATDDGLLVTDGELRWRISKNEHAYAVDFAERGDAYSRRLEAQRLEDVGDRAGDAIAYTHLADLALFAVPGRLDSEAAR